MAVISQFSPTLCTWTSVGCHFVLHRQLRMCTNILQTICRILVLLLLLSAQQAWSQNITIPSARDPKVNTSINPQYNNRINPRYNTSIDPRYNTSIDPRYNTSIDPRYNTSIDPRYNTSIDPRYNTSLDPNYNTALDPTQSRWSGYFVFDINGNVLGVAVRANMEFLLLYDTQPRWKGYFASNGKDGFNWFSKEGVWLGYAAENSEKGFNLFSAEGKWIGFLN